jgi:arginine Nomega-methyltransferase
VHQPVVSEPSIANGTLLSGPAIDGSDSFLGLQARGRVAMRRNDYTSAADYFARAATLAPDHNSGSSRMLNRAIRQLVPRWHFAMINDQERNAAYQKAIRATVRPGDVVLDIGSGTGLLALLAAQAGASAVISCEAEPRIAEVARQIIDVNGYSDRITVVDGISTDFRVGVELPARADVLVTEIFDCALLGEDALPAFEHARRDLLTADDCGVNWWPAIGCGHTITCPRRVVSM